MRHLLLSRTFPPAIGGIERYIAELFRRVDGDVSILAPRSPGADAFDKAFPHPIARFPTLPWWRHGKGPLVPMLFWAAKMAARTTYDIVFSDQVQTGGVGVPVARMSRANHVTFAYGLELSPRRLFWWKRKVYSRSAAVVAISRFAKEALVSVYDIPPEAIVIARPGVDTDRFAPLPEARSSRLQSGIDDCAPVLLTVGRLDSSQRYKGYERLIRLVQRLQHEFPGMQLVVVGDGDDRQRLEKLAHSLGVRSRVRFAGRLSDNDLVSAYRSADLFVLPSGDPDADLFSVEGYGMVFAEASASGIASVGYRTGGVSDAVLDGVTGVLSDPTEEAFTFAVRDLLRSPERRLDMGLAGRQYALKSLTWGPAVSALQELTVQLSHIGRQAPHDLIATP